MRALFQVWLLQLVAGGGTVTEGSLVVCMKRKMIYSPKHVLDRTGTRYKKR